MPRQGRTCGIREEEDCHGRGTLWEGGLIAGDDALANVGMRKSSLAKPTDIIGSGPAGELGATVGEGETRKERGWRWPRRRVRARHARIQPH